MGPEPSLAGGVAAPVSKEQPTNPNTTSQEAAQAHVSPSLALAQPSSFSANPPGRSSDKGKGVATTSEKGEHAAAPSEGKKPPDAPSKKKGKASGSETKKRKGNQSRKLDANKVAGLQKRKRSVAWDHFKVVPEDEVNDPTAECIHCGHRFLCGSKEHGTSNLLAHIKKCPKLNIVTDPSQKLLDIEGMTSGRQLAGSIPQAFDMKECRKALALFVICDEQPFRVVEGFRFKHLFKRLCPRFEVPSRRTLTRDCYELYLDERVWVKGLL